MVRRLLLILGVLLCVAGIPVEPDHPPVFGEIVTGWASQYARGVMDATIKLRQTWGQLPSDLSDYDGAVAVADCSLIGSTVWLRYNGGPWERFIIADCGSKSDCRWQDGRSGWQWMVDHNILVEVDYKTAMRWNRVGIGVRIEAIFKS